MDIALVFGALILLILFGVPVAFSMGLSTLLAFYLNGTWRLTSIIAQRMYSGSTSFILLAIPFYILAGLLMNTGGMTDRIMKFAQYLVGHISGGMGHVNIVASMIFSGMSGSSVADASGLGMVELKTMEDAGYDSNFSAAITAASATIGPVVPPSIPFVVFGGLTGVSVGRLFMGGIIPGIVMGLGLMIAVYFVAKKRDYGKNDLKFSFIDFVKSAGNALLALGSVLIILGGIVFGIFTPTEAAIVASIYAFVISYFIFRDLKISHMPDILWKTAQYSLRVIFIMAVASGYTWALTLMHVPQKLVNTFGGLEHPILFLLILNVMLLILGLFMESISIMMLVVPILMPVIIRLGIEPVHFGVMLTLNLMIGQITPPMGILLYSVASVSNIPVQKIIPELKPYWAALIIVLLLITMIPAITLWLPNLLM